MEKLGFFAVAPTLICLVYMYVRDKYEKEPWRLLVVGVIIGAVLTFPIMQASGFAMRFMPITGQLGEAAYSSFAVAALVEEGFKFVALFFLVWRNNNLNERLDGIVYAVFISLGFAGVENVLYVFSPHLGGLETALGRAVISVPSHSFFGIIMGYHFALAKFEPNKRAQHLFTAFFAAWAVHGVYNFILLSGHPYYLVVFVPFLLLFWRNGLRKIKTHLATSPFKPSY
ncbi:MAG: PrsW family glutamic-type intramembrane protease [Defluviitaleaceae bacterium]|nr:PrsW family glutamic-type intramembrane protease [Defluviitaleaceae bacterium]